MNCTNCPENCLGQDLSTRCIYDETAGKSLDSILAEIKTELRAEIAEDESFQVYTDDIISTSIVRNGSSICSSKIVKRDFTYGLSISQSTVLFNWDVLEVIKALPTGYERATVKVKLTGVSDASNVFADSTSPSAGLSVAAANFPINVDIVLRVVSPCGNIDLTSNFVVRNPSETGIFRTTLDARDLNPKSGQVNLTQQLNSLESQLSSALLSISAQKSIIDELSARVLAVENLA